LLLKINSLQRDKSRKTGKTRKKVQNNFRGTPIFLQNGPVFKAKTAPSQSRDLQAAAVVMVSKGVNFTASR
jgi:hypothetical protein